MKLQDGEVIKLSDNKEYICLKNLPHETKNYIVLMSNFKPIEIRFAEQMVDGDNIQVRIINNQDEKLKVMELFSQISLQ